jgi:hypothetical protein
MMYLKFLWSLLRHKWFVFVECCRLGIPWLGVIHDWSKFLPNEFFPYARYFYGNYPNRADIHGDMRNILSDRYTAEGVKAAFDVAWLHHQKRNRHHWQYWLLQYDNGEAWAMQEDGNQTLVENYIETGLDFIAYFDYGGFAEHVVRLLNLRPVALSMPDRYRREMLADWRGAGRAYGNPDTEKWYKEHCENIILHPETRAWVESELLGRFRLTPLQADAAGGEQAEQLGFDAARLKHGR